MAMALPDGRPGAESLAAFAKRSVQKELDSALWWAGGLPFEHHSETMRPGAERAVSAIAAVMKEYPDLGFKICCYAGSELSPPDAMELSGERAAAVKTALDLWEVPNLMAAKGMGSDGKEPRVELVPCDAHEINAVLAELRLAHRGGLQAYRSCTNLTKGGGRRNCDVSGCAQQ